MLGFPVLYLTGPEDNDVPTFWPLLYENTEPPKRFQTKRAKPSACHRRAGNLERQILRVAVLTAPSQDVLDCYYNYYYYYYYYCYYYHYHYYYYYYYYLLLLLPTTTTTTTTATTTLQSLT